MDDLALRLMSLERRTRSLLAATVLLAAAVAAQVLGWVPALRASEVRTGRIVLTSQDGTHRSIEISDRGIHLVDQDGGETWLTAPSGGDPTGLSMSGPSGHTAVSPSELRLEMKHGGAVEVRGGTRPGIVVLGGSDGQVDIGPGFAVVRGGGGVTAIDARQGEIGLHVLDGEGQRVPPR